MLSGSGVLREEPGTFKKVETRRILLIMDPEFMDLEAMGRANRGPKRVRGWVRPFL